jgi:hypothetical protein
MKLLIIIPAIIFLIIIIFLVVKKEQKVSKPIEIDINELAGYLEQLQMATANDAYLIVSLKNSENFIQFTSDRAGFQMDFPLVSASHKNLKNKFLSIASEFGLNVDRTKSLSGSDEFLDINLNGLHTTVCTIIISFTKKLFDLGDNEIIKIETNGFTVQKNEFRGN